MLNDLFWHMVVFAIVVFFAFTAITQLPAWRTGAAAYSTEPLVTAKADDPSLQTAATLTRKPSGATIQLAQAK